MTSDQADTLGPPRFVFRTPFLGGMRFEFRPLDRQPPDPTVGFLYRRDGDHYRQGGVCMFKDGQWLDGKRRLIEGDCLWAAMVDD